MDFKGEKERATRFIEKTAELKFNRKTLATHAEEVKERKTALDKSLWTQQKSSE